MKENKTYEIGKIKVITYSNAIHNKVELERFYGRLLHNWRDMRLEQELTKLLTNL